MRTSFSDFLAVIFLATVYFLVGIVFAIPYTVFASGGAVHFALAASFFPVYVLFVSVAWQGKRLFRNDRAWKVLFWGLVTYAALPILLNALSWFLKWFGFPGAAQITFALRYASLLLLPIAAFVVLVHIGILMRAWAFVSSCFRSMPPSNPGPPDSDNLGSRQARSV